MVGQGFARTQFVCDASVKMVGLAIPCRVVTRMDAALCVPERVVCVFISQFSFFFARLLSRCSHVLVCSADEPECVCSHGA